MASRKDYIKIAEALATTRPKIEQFNSDIASLKLKTAYAQWEKDVFTIDRMLAADNPRFDPVKFRQVVYGLQLWG